MLFLHDFSLVNFYLTLPCLFRFADPGLDGIACSQSRSINSDSWAVCVVMDCTYAKSCNKKPLVIIALILPPPKKRVTFILVMDPTCKPISMKCKNRWYTVCIFNLAAVDQLTDDSRRRAFAWW